jgi:hypothetical protein
LATLMSPQSATQIVASTTMRRTFVIPAPP